MRYFFTMIFILEDAVSYIIPHHVDTITVDAGKDLQEHDDMEGLDEIVLAAVIDKCLTIPDSMAGLINPGGSIEYKVVGVPISGTLKPSLCFTSGPPKKPKKPKRGTSEVWPRYGEH